MFNKPLPFLYRTLEDKELMLLECFVSKERAATARLRAIEEEEVNVLPQTVSSKVTDKQVDINLIKQYFSADAWQVVEQVLECKLKDPKWTCGICCHDLASHKSVGCDGCLEWYHLPCLKINTIPKRKYWMCPKCNSV
ncbi:hypothetical protein JTE90_014292 [Oedothorax gibbosus]|uniref:PHD-type domain-containing protein n=1 Tax=Oedothorax gibbosus TaxID=931172 RepID=A0AAV6TS43_9ARAC|nr:hypothetical protein JTE90_014292 [Oedothorax gibbosus]